jgi:hypothetical protein
MNKNVNTPDTTYGKEGEYNARDYAKFSLAPRDFERGSLFPLTALQQNHIE